MDHNLTTFTAGSRELDEIIGEIKPRTMLLVVGHPGAGKTSFASQVCYANTLKGKKCLYMTFYEDKEKLFRHMERLGIKLFEAESKGLFEYLKLPVASTDEILKIIADKLSKTPYDVVVVDSVNAAIELIENTRAQRAVLLNFFYQLVNAINGLLVVIAEIPLGKEAVELGAIEFIADIVIYLKHRITRGLITRMMELRKIRGAPLMVAEIPFSIVESQGFKVYMPPRPQRVIGGGELLRTTLRFTKSTIGYVRRGDVVYVVYPPKARVPVVLLPFVDLLISNNIRGVFISYRFSTDESREAFINALTKFTGLSREDSSRVVDRYLHLESLNPTSATITHLHAIMVELLEALNVDVVMFHGVEIFSVLGAPEEYWTSLINELYWLKNKGKLVVRFSSKPSHHWYRTNVSLSDVIFELNYKHVDGKLIPLIYSWGRGRDPVMFELSDAVIAELKEDFKKLLAILQPSKPG
ncbi:MAG: ATPase domain-containing protein [Desulfurococcaceae archaeon]